MRALDATHCSFQVLLRLSILGYPTVGIRNDVDPKHLHLFTPMIPNSDIFLLRTPIAENHPLFDWPLHLVE